MADFNKSSAKIAKLIARICHGEVACYNYTNKKSQQELTAHKFECLLLGEKEGVYMYGFQKGSQQQVKKRGQQVQGRSSVQTFEDKP